VYVTHNGTPHELYTGNISEGGVYIKTEEPYPAGSQVEISMPMEAGSHIHLRGIVRSANHPSGRSSGHPAGMGIEFKDVRDEERKILKAFLKRVSIQDLGEGHRTGKRPSLTG
jgi:uncharacterized protein (TIGR02266 family)